MKCHEKTKFKTKAAARKAQSKRNRDSKYPLHVHKCRGCKNYHLSKFRAPIRYSKLCNKFIYQHRKDAELVKHERRAAGEQYLRIYPCKKCHGYHLTKARK